MDNYIIVKITDDGSTPHPTSSELLRVYNQLDYDGMVSVLAAAYSEKLRMKNRNISD